MLWQTLVLVRRADEAEARGRLRAVEAAEVALRLEVTRLGDAARAAAARLAASRSPVITSDTDGGTRRAGDLLQDEYWRARLREEHARCLMERARAEHRLVAARAEREAARAQVADAVKRRQGAEAEARRRRADEVRVRERREEAAAADALLAARPRR